MARCEKIAVVAPSFADSFPKKMLYFIKACAGHSQVVLPFTMGDDITCEASRYQSIMKEPGPLSLIGLAVRPDPKVIWALKGAKIHLVLVEEQIMGASAVTTDNVEGGRIAGAYLGMKKKKTVAIISGMMRAKDGSPTRGRVFGFRQGLATQGVVVDDRNIVEVQDCSYDDGVRIMTQLLQEKRGVDAIFSAAGDDCAVGMMRTAISHGLRIPEDLAIIGYDDSEMAQHSAVPLTTIRQPLREMAKEAFRIAAEEAAEGLNSPRRIEFKPELVIRKSA